MRLLLSLLLFCGCGELRAAQPAPEDAAVFSVARERMVAEQIEARGVRDARVLAALRRVPRHEFVLEEDRDRAYRDGPLAIGQGQTISQPYIVAIMTALAAPGPDDRVLEIGTGSGYQAAVLAELAGEVYSIEIVEPLAERAAATLQRLGYPVQLRQGDGYRGWPEAAPFGAPRAARGWGSPRDPGRRRRAGARGPPPHGGRHRGRTCPRRALRTDDG